MSEADRNLRGRVRRAAALAACAGLAWTAAAQDASTSPVARPAAPPPAPRPAPQPAGALQPAGPGGELIQISEMSEPLELKTFVEYVGSVLGINIVAADTLTGTVVINAPIEVRHDQLLSLLDSLLMQHNFTILNEGNGFYTVQALDKVGLSLRGENPPTRIIPTPGIKPTALQATIQAQMTTPDRPLSKISFIDDLGVIVMTDTPRRLDAVRDLVAAILSRRAEQKYLRYEVEHVSASVARQRLLELLAPGTTGTAPGAAPAVQVSPEGQIIAGASGRLANLPDRLSVDAQGNALIFRGTEDEAAEVESVLAVLDVPNNLQTRVYFAGSAAGAIADIAKERGLARIQEVRSSPDAEAPPGTGAPRSAPVPPPAGVTIPGQSSAPAGGPTLVVDTSRGILLYAATASQHEQLQAILKEFDTEQDQVVIKAYPINHGDASDIADLMLQLILNQASSATASGGLLPQSQQGFLEGVQRQGARPGGLSGGLGSAGTGGERGTKPRSSTGPTGGGEGDLYIAADQKNNQVLVKAPAKLHPEFAALIEKVDLRRPQVYLEAMIVSVTASDTFRLAFNAQLINAGGTGGAIDFSTGLSRVEEDGRFTDPKNVSNNLLGLTAAVIKSEYVPIIIHALKQNTDTRILSSPQLLIDDNETAEIVALEQQPTTGSTQGTATTETSFTGFEDAGTQLTVTPTITKGGFVRLTYNVELSSFQGSGQGGIPPPRLKNQVSSDSVTIPGDTTVVIGGLTVDATTKTVIKIPLLGDIPIIGHLFRDQGKTDRKTTLYVFLTPRILREPSIPDLVLLTRGPQAEAGLDFGLPRLEPAFIEIFELPRLEPAPPSGRPRP